MLILFELSRDIYILKNASTVHTENVDCRAVYFGPCTGLYHEGNIKLWVV